MGQAVGGGIGLGKAPAASRCLEGDGIGLRGTLAGWATLMLLVGGFIGMMVTSVVGLAIPIWAPLIASGIALALIVWQWIENLAITYEISADRLILRRGIFVKSIDEIELYRVKDVRLDFTIINQMAGIGTIGITSSDTTTGTAPLTMPNVERAQARREELRALVETARQKRGLHRPQSRTHPRRNPELSAGP